MKENINPERVHRRANPFRVGCFLNDDPGLSLRSNPGLKLANAFGVLQSEPALKSGKAC